MKNEYYIDTVEPIVHIYMKDGLSTIVDLDDFYKLDETSTYSIRPNGYVARITSRKLGKRTTSYIHREIMEYPENMQIDHINGDKLDNRKCNLRIVTNAQNAQNRTKNYSNAKSEHRGVIWSERDNAWISRVKLNGKQYYLGTYASEEMASLKAIEFRKANMPYSEEGLS